MGFEIKVPAEWEGSLSGGSPRDFFVDRFDSFWFPRLGSGTWKSERAVVDLFVKTSTTTLRDFDKGIGERVGANAKEIFVNGVPALRNTETPHEGVSNSESIGRYQSQDIVLLKKDDAFCYVEFREHASSLDEAKSNFKEWEAVLASIRFFPIPTSTIEAISELDGPPSAVKNSTPSLNVNAECKRIESEFSGPVLVKPAGWDRVERYPISKKYEHVKTVSHEWGYEESYHDVVARAFTASDCDQDQVERLFGQRMTGRVPLMVRFSVKSPSTEFRSFLEGKKFQCSVSDFSGLEDCYFPNDGTIQDLVDLKQYASFIESVMEID